MTSDSAAGRPPLGGLFFPKAVALVGASDRSYLARQVWESIRGGRYKGPVYPINPNRETVYGTKCYPILGDVPSKPDLCLIAVSETAVGGVLRDCAANGIGSVILYTVFSNTADGESLRQSARASAAANSPVVAGPGTFGLLNHGARFIPLMSPLGNTRVGNVALVCQSGGIMNCVLGALGHLGVGLSKIVATGGEDCLGAVDYLDYFLDVDPPAVIGCALEQVKDLARFVFGLGGTFVEDVGATALRLSPLGVRDAEALVRESHVASAMERLAGDSAAPLIQEIKRLILAFDGLCQVLARSCGVRYQPARRRSGIKKSVGTGFEDRSCKR